MSETNSSYPYASAQVKAMESALITKEKLGRVIEARNSETAMRVLQEIGYGQSLQAGASFEQLIEIELREADNLLAAISPSDVFIRIMRADKDYHNLKVLIKLFMQDKNLDEADLIPGNIPVDTLRRAIIENNYYELPETMKAAFGYIDKQFAVAADASIIGVAMDRAYAKQIQQLLPQMNDALVTQYFTAYFDLSNIIAFMRIRVSGHAKESFERACLRAGSIDKRTFSEAFDLADESIMGALITGDYTAAMTAAFDDFQKTGRLYMMEKAKDDYLLQLLKAHKHDMFGIGPLMCYYIGKQREAAAVRLVMTAKQGGIDTEVVTARVKELF